MDKEKFNFKMEIEKELEFIEREIIEIEKGMKQFEERLEFYKGMKNGLNVANEFFNQYMKNENDVSDNVFEEMEGKMSKISELIKERVFIVNKEHLTKEDYERIAEIEIEIREIKKSGKDNNVPTKKTNREMLANMDNFQLAHFIVENIMTECVEPICCCTFGSEECERLNTCVVGIMKWLESEVE